VRICNSSKCAYSTDERLNRCPKCGTRMRDPTRLRVLGVIQMLMGLFLIVLIGVITFNLAPQLLRPAETMNGSTFTGTAQQGMMILGLFGMVIAFGVGATVNGLWQIVTGKRNIWLAIMVFVLAAILFVIGAVVTNGLK